MAVIVPNPETHKEQIISLVKQEVDKVFATEGVRGFALRVRADIGDIPQVKLTVLKHGVIDEEGN